MSYLELAKRVIAEMADRHAKDPSAPSEQPGSDLLDRFLDGDYPAAIFRSKPLGRALFFARDEAALAALTEADRQLPVLFFGEAEKLRRMGLQGLRVLLDFRTEFGPSVELCSVRVPDA